MDNPALATPAPDRDPVLTRYQDVEAVNSAQHRSLYKAREPIYPKLVAGTFRRLKWIVLFVTLGIYYLLPWLRWERGINEPDQAILVDFPGGRFYFFFIELWTDELYYVTGLLILAAFGLFLATALFGRIWCGYTCPQTVWTDLFIAVERMIEGDRNQRIKLAKSPWSFDKLRKKITKHFVWLLIGMATGGAWIFYFHDAPTVLPQLFQGTAPATAYIFLIVLTVTTYVFAGMMREQVCTYLCPWPRIQAALTDAETLQVTYKTDRGEPRGAHRKNESWEGRGDCISCRACVAACPMGIDIRDGLQLECINCALCIDACDEIMTKVGRPTGLIGYDTDANIARRQAGINSQFRFMRPRTAIYGVLLLAVTAIMAYALVSRTTTNLTVIRDRTPPFVTLSNGDVRNAYTLKITNRENFTRKFEIAVDGPQGLKVKAVGEIVNGNGFSFAVNDDTVRTVRFLITIPKDQLVAKAIPLTLHLSEPEQGGRVSSDTVFLSGK